MGINAIAEKAEILKQVRVGSLTADAAIRLLKRQSAPARPAIETAARDTAEQAWEDRFLDDLVDLIGRLLHLDAHAVDLDTPVADMGLDSLSATEFNNKMRARFAIGLQATAFFECSTIRDFYRYMLRIYPKQLQAHYATASPAVPSAPAVSSPVAQAAAPQAVVSGDPIRIALDRVWRLAEQELESEEAARPRRCTAELDVERLLIERPRHPPIEVCFAGSGRPLLLLGGMMNPERIWHNQVRALAPRFRVLIFNKPGCGRSGVDIHRLSMDTIVSDLLHVLDTFNLQAALPVVGFSFGGMVAQSLAVRYPERVSALALINSAAFHRPRPDEVKILIDEVARCPEVAVINGDVDFALAANYREVTKSFDLRASLPALPQPALVLSSGLDGYITPERSEELAHLLKQARHVALPESGHFSLLTHPDLVNSRLLDFLDAIQPAEPRTLAAQA